MTCETEPEKGGIKVSWSFTYTGGLPLTNILVDHLENGVPTDPTLVRTDDRTVLIPRLTAGTLYHPRITASTSFGSRTLDCPGITLDIGKIFVGVQLTLVLVPSWQALFCEFDVPNSLGNAHN